MNSKLDYLIDSIFNKLKKYKNREIFLEKENLKKFILLLFKENWIQGKYKINCYSKQIFLYDYV